MNKREAKRLACFHAALVIEGALENGWDQLGDPSKDRDKIENAMVELVDEFRRRGGDQP